MKNVVLASIALLSVVSTVAQVDIDKSINLSSSTPADAKITGIKQVTAAQDAVSAEALQSGKLVYATAVSGVDDISLTFSPAFTATSLAAGTIVSFKAVGTNTTNVRLNVSGLGLKPLYKDVSANLAASNILNGQIVSAVYDGINFHLISRIADANSGGTVTSIGTTAPITGGTITGAGTIGLTQTGDVLAGTGISVTGGTDKLPGTADLTINNSGVLSVGSSGVISSSGGQNPSISLTGVVPIANGGTALSSGPSAAGQYLRSSGSGTWAVNTIQAGDIPAGSGNYIQNGTGLQSANFNISGSGTFSGAIRRNDHAAGFFEGSYNNIGGNSAYTNPIYTIGSAYNPTSTSLSNMYGIGFSHGNFWGNAGGRPGGWGLYVASAGAIRVILESDAGIVWSSGSVRSPIFYDTDNTGYYLDPASTTNLNNLRFNTVDCINGNCPPNNAIRLTPNFHINAGNGYAVILNWDNGTTSGQALRVGNGAGFDAFNVFANGDVNINNKHAIRGNDSWLRLNQDGGFSSGIYSPGFLRVDGGFASGGLNNPGAGNMRASNYAIARTLISGEYQHRQGPGTGADNQNHQANCDQGWAMVNFSVYATSRWDGNIQLNCANLSGVLSGSWFWQPSQYGAGNADNVTFVINCPSNHLSSGFYMYATGQLDYNANLLCAPLNGGYSNVNNPGFPSAQQGPGTGADDAYHSASCPAGTFVSGMQFSVTNYADGNLQLRCTGINFP